MMKMTIYDVAILQNYFANKREPTEQDKERAAKLDRHLCAIVDGLALVQNDEKMGVSEIFEKLTGEKLENYR